ncbi:MAG: YggS family pyridoxal phosphate-dependent enzyme [Anaerolineales bacterium]
MTENQDVDIAGNLNKVKQEIITTARAAGRDPEQIKLVVVTKEKSANTVKRVVEAGVNKIGESYVQEAVFKMDLLSDFDIEWHMIGTIQRGKVKHVAYRFDFLHSLDRYEIAKDLNEAARENDRVLPVLLECNVSGQKSKHGWPAWEEDRWDVLADDLAPVMEMKNLKIWGLMTMAPYFQDPERSRPIFRKLKQLQGYLSERFEDHDLEELSMGMSSDYHIAVQEGATILRIGSAIVGPRN